jgi:hypothetical protein
MVAAVNNEKNLPAILELGCQMKFSVALEPFKVAEDHDLAGVLMLRRYSSIETMPGRRMKSP